MAKQLLLIRHAKSDWNHIKLSDFDRTLNPRGEKNAPQMAQRLSAKNIIPEQIVSSPAVRALTTARYFANEFGIAESTIVEEKRIYEATVYELMNVVNKLDNSSSFTALFGHNPGISNLADTLCNENLYAIPTCAVVLIYFPFDNWNMISAGTGELILYDYPKNGEF
jgi:phosphohistidine phosphatase